MMDDDNPFAGGPSGSRVKVFKRKRRPEYKGGDDNALPPPTVVDPGAWYLRGDYMKANAFKFFRTHP